MDRQGRCQQGGPVLGELMQWGMDEGFYGWGWLGIRDRLVMVGLIRSAW